MKRILFFFGVAVLLSAAETDFRSDKHTIKGEVLDINGDPLIGASVLIKGTQNGAVTDFNGLFEITTEQECVDLQITYVGYAMQEITKACAGKWVKVVMTEEQALEEVVVVTGRKKIKTENKISAIQTKPSAKADWSGASVPIQTLSYDPETEQNWNTEDYDLIVENRFFEVTKEPLSTFSIDVDAASYSNLRRYIKNGIAPPKDAVRIEEMVNYFDYDYPQPSGEHPFEIITEIGDCPWASEHRLLHIGLQGKAIPTEELPASNLVFLIDVSGSMDAANKLPLLQASFKLLTDQLREKDRVAVVVYAGAAGLVLEPTSGANKQKIKEAIEQLRAGGSTAGGAGIELAYKTAREYFIKGGNNRVILATDGDFNIGASSDAEMVRLIEKERESGVFLTVLGFGMGNYKDNKMQQLADKGNGNHAYIDDISEAKKVLVSEFGGTVFTIAKDVKIQIEFNPGKVQAYRLIGYENRVLNHEDFNDDKKDAGELGSGHTVTALYEIIPVGVKSAFVGDVDALKYQKLEQASSSKEWATVKFRYKQPDGSESQKMELSIKDKSEKASENFQWSAAVAEFGMLLRDSEYKGTANYNQAIQLAKASKGKDENGYRREMIDMMEVMRSLADADVAKD
ncbi:MAG TPA: von Willebrand factor type A domain-containing protein [Saprospiraceae bacterium]|nr:von Willebrand factor type A domain-containing protein [Saprospiraceae bacterium]HMQ81397.1 von Willebrand factor type A domain-containing protein [Saprospiraceae bacterium]